MCVSSVSFLLLLTHGYDSRPMTSAEEWLTVTWLAKTVAALDASAGVLLAGLVIFLLHRNRTGFRRTESMINQLIIMSINTGLLTSICAVLTFIFVSRHLAADNIRSAKLVSRSLPSPTTTFISHSMATSVNVSDGYML